MSYDWEKQANQEGGGEGTQDFAPKLPNGRHAVEVTRVVFSKKDGPAFESKKGDPQIMLIFADADGREVSQMYTLSEAACFRLAQVLSAAGANCQSMSTSGIEPTNFAVPDFANKQLIGRKLVAQVLWDSANKWATVNPVRRDAYATMGEPDTTTNAEIPF